MENMPPHPMYDDTPSNTRHRRRTQQPTFSPARPQQRPSHSPHKDVFTPEYSQTLLEMDAAKTLISPPPEDSIRPSASRQSVCHVQSLSSWHALNVICFRSADIALPRTCMNTLSRRPRLHMAALLLDLGNVNDSTYLLLILLSPLVNFPAIPIYQIQLSRTHLIRNLASKQEQSLMYPPHLLAHAPLHPVRHLTGHATRTHRRVHGQARSHPPNAFFNHQTNRTLDLTMYFQFMILCDNTHPPALAHLLRHRPTNILKNVSLHHGRSL